MNKKYIVETRSTKTAEFLRNEIIKEFIRLWVCVHERFDEHQIFSVEVCANGGGILDDSSLVDVQELCNKLCESKKISQTLVTDSKTVLS